MTPLEIVSMRLCAYRLDSNVSAEQFVEAVDELIWNARSVDTEELAESQASEKSLEQEQRLYLALMERTNDKIERAAAALSSIVTDAEDVPTFLANAIEEAIYILREKVLVHVPEEDEG